MRHPLSQRAAQLLLASTLALSSLVFSCGNNVAADYDTSDPDTEAMKALERGDESEAIRILNDAYRGDRDNPRYCSLMSAALLQKHGIDIISIVLEMGTDDSGNQTRESDAAFLIDMWSYLPEPTTARLDGIERAVELIQTIPTSRRGMSDFLKLTIGQVSWASLKLKSFDVNDDGTIDAADFYEMGADAQDNIDGMFTTLAAFASDASGSSDIDEEDDKVSTASSASTSLGGLNAAADGDGDGSISPTELDAMLNPATP
jgi:hypothetical protein